MSTLTQRTNRKLSLLQLAEEFGNVSKGCKIMGYQLRCRIPPHVEHASTAC